MKKKNNPQQKKSGAETNCQLNGGLSILINPSKANCHKYEHMLMKPPKPHYKLVYVLDNIILH